MTRDSDRYRARDSALRRTRATVGGIVAGAVALSGACSAVAAHAFKGHSSRAVASPVADPSPAVRVPGPERVPPIAGDPAPLEPPAEPPVAAAPEPSAPAPEVSGGS